MGSTPSRYNKHSSFIPNICAFDVSVLRLIDNISSSISVTVRRKSFVNANIWCCADDDEDMVVEVLLPFLFFLLLLNDLCFDLRVVELILLRDILVVSCNILLHVNQSINHSIVVEKIENGN